MPKLNNDFKYIRITFSHVPIKIIFSKKSIDYKINSKALIFVANE